MLKRKIKKKKNILIRKKIPKSIHKKPKSYFFIILKRNIIKYIYIIILFSIFLLFNNSFILDIIYTFLLKYTSRNIKVGLCAVGKGENLYAKEFVNYYKKLGYNHIFIYDNNPPKGERFEDVIQEEINSNFVSIIDVRRKIIPQCFAYRDCYSKNSKNFDWLSFFDFDEFLEVTPKARTIQEFLGNKRYDKCVNVKINFLYYTDNDLLYYDPRPLQVRFTKPCYKCYNNMVIKSTVRGGLDKNYWAIGCTPHTSHANYTSCNSLGEVIHHKSGVVKPPIFLYARLKHYYSKSLQEYVNKSKRGDAFIPTYWNQGRKMQKFRHYFLYSNRTKEKEELLKKYFDMK